MMGAGGLLWNPIIEKEIRSRMRSWRAPALLTLYLGLLGAVGYQTLSVLARDHALTGGAGMNPAQMGVQIFAVLAAMELLLISFMTPALTAGAISGERERQTLDLLLCTRVRPTAIVTGKLLSSLLFVLLLLLASVPLFSAVFLFGGVELDQVLSIVAIGLVTAVVLGSLGLFFSVVAQRSTAATVGSYALALLLLVGTLLAGYAVRPSTAAGANARPAPPLFVLANPIVALGSSLPQGAHIGSLSFPTLASFRGPSVNELNGRPIYRIQDGYAEGGASLRLDRSAVAPVPYPQPARAAPADLIPAGPFQHWRAWQAFSALNLLLAGLLLVASVVLLRGRSLRPRVMGRARGGGDLP